MKPLELTDLMNIIEYEKVRDEYRQNIIAYKKNRRIHLGPNITMTFENRKTLLFQIQEIMRAERLVHDEQIQEEIDVYNSIMPLENGLSATLFIEVTDEAKIRPVLNKFIGLTEAQTLFFNVNGQKIFAEFEAGREEADKISSVHYLRFLFNEEVKNSFSNEESDVELTIDYKDYHFSEKLSEEIKSSLSGDLE